MFQTKVISIFYLFSSTTDVPAWLKSLRLHKYAALFSTMTYDEMMSLTEEQLEAQVFIHFTHMDRDSVGFQSVLEQE